MDIHYLSNPVLIRLVSSSIPHESKGRTQSLSKQPYRFVQCLSGCKGHGVNALWFCLQATSWYGEELEKYMTQLGHTVSIINPAPIKAYA